MVRSNIVYAYMKVLGKQSGNYDDMHKDMGIRFKGQGRQAKPATASNGGNSQVKP